MNYQNYPKIYAIGKDEVKDVFKDPIVIEEKVDGSQISFYENDKGLHIFSRNQKLDLDEPEKMFATAVENIKRLSKATLIQKWFVYRGEYLKSPRHNKLAYKRVPDNNIVIYDIQAMNNNFGYLAVSDKIEFAKGAGFSYIPVLYSGQIMALNQLKDIASGESFLGGQMEGVVIKNYFRKGWHHDVIFAKYVNDAFKEVKNVSTKPGTVDQIVEDYATDARYDKVIQHLRERGELNNEMADIPNLMKELYLDLDEEEEGTIKERLYKAYKKEIYKGISRGLPAYYKMVLDARQFETEN